MNILITGGCGFIGSNFINYYYKKDDTANIVNIDALYYCANEKNVADYIRESKRYTFISGNLCSLDLEGILRKHKINFVLHFAAQSHVQSSFDDSIQYTLDNVVGTHCLLEAVKKYNEVQKFIHISTDEVYGESMLDCTNKKTELSTLCPTNPYAATKAAAELIAKSYYYSFKVPIIITRGNNVYGPNQYPEKLIPKFIELLKANEPVTIQGDGTNVRSFIHVNDVCTALVCVLDKGVVGEIYNLGSDEKDEYSVLSIAKKLIRLIHRTTDYDQWIRYIEDRPFNDKRYYISNDKVKKLGWEIVHNFEDGLRNLIIF